MFQSFDTQGDREAGPERLIALRGAMADAGLDAFLIPRADAHQGEYVAPRDARLQWLTGFTGSAGFAAVTADHAALFVDGRYTVQGRDQVAEVFDVLRHPTTKLGDWLADHLPQGAQVGFDPWLHTRAEIDALRERLGPEIGVVPVTPNPLDTIWSNQPAPPQGLARAFPTNIAGATRSEKIALVCDTLEADGHAVAVLSLPDSLCWLLNIRGSDIPRNPVVHAFATVEAATQEVRLFCDSAKLRDLDLGLPVFAPDAIVQSLAYLSGPVRLDRDSAPYLFGQALEDADVNIAWAADPCLLPKARKTDAEIDASRTAHLRDGAAMCAFLHWVHQAERRVLAGERITEIDVVVALEDFRGADDALRDISFETIAGSGPHGAIVHYRVTQETDRALAPGELLLVDSGGQYDDGTTDITRTIAIGTPGAAEIAAFTRVLQGMIAVSRARWPKGLAGRDLDALARAPLWMAGQDYDHGTGHGVGVHLSVHEGPQRLSRSGEITLDPGMILSNEPGYYRAGAFGIRIENLVVVTPAPDLPDQDDREMLSFETLTWAPIDRRLIDVDALSPAERAWIDTYHAGVAQRMAGRLSPDVAAWLGEVTRPL
ncbi:putative peptidase [Rhodobacteraceae bacterium THAF1]|uniref:aminopeptidase P family protein n=1 Tax=Palleronia sp. THAF1 TaxID=2587842 RepID=UPI000F40E46D|nr:aminopeptidase P family protein [Palleronia sp. THAF1]QFU09263.1 putative peptidase [Palleronia sp. THAF1]VDC27392.1 putative peptidase [Rhodobacteraceae bacterium THAF1]